MRKALLAILILFAAFALCACSSDPEAIVRESPAFKLEEQGFYKTCASAVSSDFSITDNKGNIMSGSVLYANYNVYKRLSKEQEMQIAQLNVMEASGETVRNNKRTITILEAHVAFYNKSSNKRIDRFVYRDSKRLKPDENTYFLPANKKDAPGDT